MEEKTKEQSVKVKLLNFLASPIGKALIICMLYVIVIGIIMVLVDQTGAIAGIAFVALAYFGWTALNKIQPEIFLIMPIGGWLIYILVKGLLSIFVGVFVAPFIISRKITKWLASMAKELAEREDESNRAR